MHVGTWCAWHGSPKHATCSCACRARTFGSLGVAMRSQAHLKQQTHQLKVQEQQQPRQTKGRVRKARRKLTQAVVRNVQQQMLPQPNQHKQPATRSLAVRQMVKFQQGNSLHAAGCWKCTKEG